MVGDVILRQIVKEQVRKLNVLVSDLLSLVNFLEKDQVQVKLDIVNIAKKLAEIVTETWEEIKEVPVAKRR